MNKIRKVVFPVAGLGTRFLPATKVSPKEMLPIVDKPLIQYAAEEAINSGIDQLIFVIGRTKNAIIDHFDSSPELEQELLTKKKHNLLKIIKGIVPKKINCFFVRQDKPAGLGDAIYCAKDIIQDDPFAVILADDLIKSKTPCIKQMIQLHDKYKKNVIAIEKINKKDSNKYGIIEYTKKPANSIYEIKSIVEKPSPKNAKSNFGVVGRYILSSKIFSFIENSKATIGNEIQLTDAIVKLMRVDKVVGYEFNGKRFDCGSKIGYLKATVDYALEHPEVRKDFKSYIKKFNGS